MQLSTDKLKSLRREKGWSQEVLAKASGLSARTIQRIESDGTSSAESTLAIASVFDLPPHALMATSNDIQVNWKGKTIMKNVLALAILSGVVVMLFTLAGNTAFFVNVPSALYLVLFLYAATIIAFGTEGLMKSLYGLKYLFTDEMVGGAQARYLSELYKSQVKFLYGGALVGLIIGTIAILANVDTYDNFVYQRASAVNLIVLLYAALLAEVLFRPLSLKLKTCDMPG